MQHLFLENKDGQIIRTFRWNGDKAFIVRCIKTKRLELWTEAIQKEKQKNKVSYKILATIFKTLPKHGLLLSSIGFLKQGHPKFYSKTQLDIQKPLENHQYIYTQGFLITLIMVSILSLILQASKPEESDIFKKEMRARIVQIRKNFKSKPIPIIMQKMTNFTSKMDKKTEKVKKQEKQVKKEINKNTKKNIQDIGALAILGAITNNSQNLQLDLSSAKKSLYGSKDHVSNNKASMKKQLYAKGVFAVPTITGGNIEGGGGYNTKGKGGGGRSNYGKISLIDSSKKGLSLSDQSGDDDRNQGLSPEQELELDSFITRKEGLLRRCYEVELQVFPEFEGSVFLSWTVDRNYKAKDILIEKIAMNKNLSINLEQFKKCILDHINSWVFPSLLKDEKLNYVFTFNRSSS